MRLNSNTSLKLISLFPLMLLLSLSTYFMYTSYVKYQETVKLRSTLQSNKILKNLSINLAVERGLSATYYGGKSKKVVAALKKQRVKTNRAIREFNNYFKNKELDPTLTKVFKGLLKITSVRASVDKMKMSFQDMFFNYYSKLNSLIFDEYRKVLNNQLTPTILSEVTFETDLLKRIEKTGQERGFISYILAKKMPFTVEEFTDWLKLFTSSDLTSMDIRVTNQNVRNRLFVLFHNSRAKKLYNQITRAKINIIDGSDIGYYQIEPSTWFNLMTRKIALLSSADNLVSIEVGNDIRTWFENDVRPKLTIAMGVFLMTIFLLIIGFFIDRYIRRSIKELEKLFSKVGQLADIDEEIDFQTTEGIEKGYRIIEIAIDQIQQDKQIALEASKAKSIFLANMSHEIRTPLNGIIGFTELLKNTNISGEERDFVDIIEKSSENLLEIINNILDLSKIESDKIEIEEILFSPITEFENAVEVFGAKAAEKNIRLSFYMDPSLNNYLNGDPTKIKEVLINLLSNAIKFTPIDGEIDVEIKRVGNVDAFGRTKVYFSVQDNGIGISEDKLKTIFDAFSQADSTITRKYGGTGLGLTISSKFIALMGGKLEVESKTGEGTKFFFTLEFDESPSSELNFHDKFTEYRCALLASEKDKKNHTQYVYDYLKYFGCDVVFFYSYKEIKGLMFRENINFMILDIDYIEENEIEDYKTIHIPSIIILKSSMQSISSKYTNDFIKPLYEPVNVTKLANILEKQRGFLPKIEHKKEVISEEEESIPVKQEEQETQESKLQILVAEDNEINRKLIKRTLENYGAEITLANNGEEALNEVKNKKFDLIFMDIAMPVMDGVEALHAILNYELNKGVKHTPVVALTANALKGDRERFLNEGFDEYVTKPIKSESIESVLSMFLKDKVFLSDGEVDSKEEAKKDEEDIQSYDFDDKKNADVENLDDTKDEQNSGEDEEVSAKLKINLDEYEDNFYIDAQEDEDDIVDNGEPSLPSSQEVENITQKQDENSDLMPDDEDIDIGLSDLEKEQKLMDELFPQEQKEEDVDIDKPDEQVDIEREVLDDSKSTEDKKENSSQISTLIAEDNVINQKLIEKTLHNLGLKVDIASNGEEAVEMFKKKKYDIVFMDISMPVMDGIDATHEILAYEKEKGIEHTPVVALTANALPGDREAFLSEGLDEYISKPLKKEDLIKVLKIFLNYESSEDPKFENIEEEDDNEHFGANILDEDLPSYVKEESEDEPFFDLEQINEQARGDESDVEEKKGDILIFKNNKIEAKILKNMIEKFGFSVDIANSYDEFVNKTLNIRYKVIMIDKEIEFVDTKEIIYEIHAKDQAREENSVIIEFVSVQDSNKNEDSAIVDEVIDNVINKGKIKEILEKYIR